MSGATVQQINELLREACTEEGVRIWWRSPNRNLRGHTPEALFNGSEEEAAEVLAEAERLAGA